MKHIIYSRPIKAALQIAEVPGIRLSKGRIPVWLVYTLSHLSVS
jgi:hypothetical protein